MCLFIPVAKPLILDICLVPVPSSVYLFPGILHSPVSLVYCCLVDFLSVVFSPLLPLLL